MAMVSEDQAKLPYGIAFTVINNAKGETQIILNVKQSVYSVGDGSLIAQGYEDILRKFAARPEEQVRNEWKFRKPVLQQTLAVGRGKCLSLFLLKAGCPRPCLRIYLARNTSTPIRPVVPDHCPTSGGERP